jgi:hypothetical protein
MTSLRAFKPQLLDLDIYAQDVKGLGRGRGFKVVGRGSALDKPSVTEPIKGRLLDLSLMLYREGLLSKEELVKRFDLILPKDYQALEEERDVLQADLEEAEEGFSGKLNDLTDLIADALGEDREDWEAEIEGEGKDRAYATLRYALERLIDEYQAIKAMQEEKS